MRRWIVLGGLLLAAWIAWNIAASPQPGRTAGDVVAILVAAIALGAPAVGVCLTARGERRAGSGPALEAPDPPPGRIATIYGERAHETPGR